LEGLNLILWGFFKKVAIADSFAISVNSVYENQGSSSGGDVAIATMLFAFQIYCDFSGYTDIARGISKLLGIELMLNFNMPYFSKDPSEFWQRWHISLSTWLRDYLYIPLGGNRRGNTYKNLMITMILGGLWHGAGWNFILWGIYQGSLLCLYRFFKIPTIIQSITSNHSRIKSDGITILSTGLFFVLTCYGWLLFRANSFSQIVEFSQVLITDLGNMDLQLQKPALSGLLGLPILVISDFCAYYLKPQLANFKLNSYVYFLRGGLYASLVLLIIMGASNGSSQFIYFQF
jgi:D-alanyl-lipoteichoic acid acyltransferase DltB (MBOAT superfamily)